MLRLMSVRTHVMRLSVVVALLGIGLTLPLASAHAVAPSNNDFGSAESIGSFPVAGTNVDATLQTNEYDFGQDLVATVWYSFSPDSSGLLKLNTCDSDFDTVLVVWESPGSIPTTGDTPLAVNDDSDAPGCGLSDDERHLGSQVTFQANASTTYYIQVGGYDRTAAALEEGSFTLTADYVSAAGNNDFEDVTTFSGSSVVGSNFAATLQANEYSYDDDLQNSVWFRFVADSDGTTTVNTCDARFDSVLIVWEEPSSLPTTSDTPLVEDDDAEQCGAQNPRGSFVSFSATAGREYYVQIGNYGPGPAPEQNQGTFTLSLSAPPAAGSDQTPPAWFQSKGQPAGGECDSSQGWLPTWEQWMNEGLGGATCYRVIAWYRGGWAVGNNSGPNGTFRPVEGASIDGVAVGSGGQSGGKADSK